MFSSVDDAKKPAAHEHTAACDSAAADGGHALHAGDASRGAKVLMGHGSQLALWGREKVPRGQVCVFSGIKSQRVRGQA